MFKLNWIKYFTTLICTAVSVSAGAQNYPEKIYTYPGDLSQDGVVGTDDLLQLLMLWGFSYDDLFLELSCDNANSVSYFGYEYSLVAIGEQCWFAENLRTQQYSNGDYLQSGLSDNAWRLYYGGAQCVYNETGSGFGSDDTEENLKKYGRLYNLYAVVDARGLCPQGWHVSTIGDWEELERFIGMKCGEEQTTGWRGTNEGGFLKASPNDSTSWNGENTFGFTALPGSSRSSINGAFQSETIGAFWCWVPTTYTDANSRTLDEYSSMISAPTNYTLATEGRSVRCVMD